MNENKIAGNNQNVGTATTTTGVGTPNTNVAQPRMFSEDQVKSMMKKRVNRSHLAFFKRYGVGNLDELDQLFQRAQESDGYKQQVEDLKNQFAESNRTVAFLKNNIDENRYDDIIAHFKGKGQDFSEETLKDLLITHPEWLKKSQSSQVNGNNTTTFSSVGVNRADEQSIDEKAIASKYFGVEL